MHMDCSLLALIIIISDKDFFGSVNLFKLTLCIFLNVGDPTGLLSDCISDSVALHYVITPQGLQALAVTPSPAVLYTNQLHSTCLTAKGSQGLSEV